MNKDDNFHFVIHFLITIHESLSLTDRLLCWVKAMLMKYCDRCRRQLRIGQKCPVCFKARNKSYAKDDFYQSSEWLKVRRKCIELCCGLDLYSLYCNNTIEFGYTVHHIEPVEVSPQLRLEQSNLIYLSESSHQIVHNLYRQGKYLETVKFLKSIKEKFIRGAV